MGYAVDLMPPLSEDAQRAIAYLGIDDPRNHLRDFDVDVDSMRTFAADLQSAVGQAKGAGETVRAAHVDGWQGAAAVQYDDCKMQWYDYLLVAFDWILFIVDCIVAIVDWIIEIIRWVLNLIDWVLGILSVFGAVLLLADEFGWRIPGWVRWLLKAGKLVEKLPKLILTVVAAAAWLVGKVGWVVDWLLDRLRDGINWIRDAIDECGGAPEKWPDQPIEPNF